MREKSKMVQGKKCIYILIYKDMDIVNKMMLRSRWSKDMNNENGDSNYC